MLRIAESLRQDHDLGLVVLAFLVCALAALTTERLLGWPRGDRPKQNAWRTGAAVLAFSAGVWTTHFISMLAFRPGDPIGFDLSLCILSLALAIAGTSVAFAMRPQHGDANAGIVATGVFLAAGIGGMHFVGMASMHMPEVIHYHSDLVAASLVLGTLFSIAAMGSLARQAAGWPSVCLMLAVVSTHFIAMGALRLTAAPGTDIKPLGIPRAELVMAAGGASLLILSLVLAVSIFDRYLARRLSREAHRFRTLADATFEGLILERRGRVVDVNRAMCDLAGTDAASLIGRPLTDLTPGIELRAERDGPIERVVRVADGTTTPVEILWRSGPDGGEHVVAVRDLSREKAAQGQIEWMARFDPLTGLANRELFERQLHQALALANRTSAGLSLLYVDLDRFEILDETLGRHATDQILRQTAHRLRSAVRQSDTVARIGRDEFVIIEALAGQPADAAALADRIMREMSLPFSVDDQPVSVTASIGVAVHPGGGTRPQDLIKNAMLAVRQAKTEGRARWRYFEAGMDHTLQTKRMLERDLGTALKEGQFVLNYQPFVDAGTLDTIGFEALLRWDHPERGRVPPADFIPLAEECGLIVPIGTWVLETACAEAVSWAKPLVISVNLSPVQLVDPGLVDSVANILEQTALPPCRLELEITEGTLMLDAANALRVLTSLKALGVKIAMDDFGTGYSSLSYLRKFPFDKIKIDRSFMHDLEEDSEAGTIVQAIIAMSRSLGLDVTAEGVETQQQLSMLRSLGCQYVQGYLLGRPRSVIQPDLRPGSSRWHVIDNTGSHAIGPSAVRSS